MIHKIKIVKPYADAVLSGDKTFEVRYDDRGYQKGDVVKFNVIDNDNHEINHPLNDKEFEITYVLHGWGLKDSWCVFSIEERAHGERAEKGLSIVDRLYTEGRINNTEQGVLRRAILLPETPHNEWNNHTVACLLADLFGDPCACNFCGIDEWLPKKCDFANKECPDVVGVACWEQFLKYRKGGAK